MDITQRWINEFNNFQSVYMAQPTEKELFHSCDLNGLHGILANQYFFATNLFTFNDPNEGRLSLSKLADFDLGFTDTQKQYIREHISGDALTEILKEFPVYVLCTSLNSDQDFFFNRFHSDAINKGADYQLTLKAEELRKHLWIETGKGCKRSDCLRFGNIIYDGKHQQTILQDNLKSFWELISKDSCLRDEVKLDYIIRKCYFLGTYFKRPNVEVGVSADEKEFRIAVNTLSNDYVQGGNISDQLPKGDKRNHIFIHFTNDFIIGITAKNQHAYDELYKDSAIKSYIETHNIKPQIWKADK